MITDIESSRGENAKTVTTLDSLLRQLNRKEALLADLDAKILLLINGEDELEAEVFEAEEIQSKLAETVSNIKSFTTHLLRGSDKVLQSEQPKSKIPEPAASITVPESPLTDNLEAIHNTEHNPDDSISLPHPPAIVSLLTEDKLPHVYQN